MNTDKVLQKQRLGTTQTDQGGGEGGWCAWGPSPGRDLGQPVGELSRVDSSPTHWPSVSWAEKHPWEEEEILNL